MIDEEEDYLTNSQICDTKLVSLLWTNPSDPLFPWVSHRGVTRRKWKEDGSVHAESMTFIPFNPIQSQLITTF